MQKSIYELQKKIENTSMPQWTPSNHLLSMQKQECCQAFAADASIPTSMADMMQMGVTHAVATEVPKPEHTWNPWKKHFNDAFNEFKELNAITAE